MEGIKTPVRFLLLTQLGIFTLYICLGKPKAITVKMMISLPFLLYLQDRK